VSRGELADPAGDSQLAGSLIGDVSRDFCASSTDSMLNEWREHTEPPSKSGPTADETDC